MPFWITLLVFSPFLALGGALLAASVHRSVRRRGLPGRSSGNRVPGGVPSAGAKSPAVDDAAEPTGKDR